MAARLRFVLPIMLPLVSVPAGCAPSGSFPSLMPRPAEATRQAVATPAGEPVESPMANAALAAQLDRLVADAAKGQQAFDAELEAARALIAKAGPVQSESWIEAQMALSRLEAARVPTVSALSDLDALAVEGSRDSSTANAADQAAVAAALAQVGALDAAQQAELQRLSGLLRGD